MNEPKLKAISAAEIIAQGKAAEQERSAPAFNRQERRKLQALAKERMQEYERAQPPISKEQYEELLSVRKSEGENGRFNKGRYNIWRCAECQALAISKDVDYGTTPFQINCVEVANPTCGGLMQSYFYNVPDHMACKEGIQFYSPTYEEYRNLPVNVRDHIESFALIFRKAEWIDANEAKAVMQ